MISVDESGTRFKNIERAEPQSCAISAVDIRVAASAYVLLKGDPCAIADNAFPLALSSSETSCLRYMFNLNSSRYQHAE